MTPLQGPGEGGFVDRFAQEVVHAALEGEAPVPWHGMGRDGHDPGPVRM